MAPGHRGFVLCAAVLGLTCTWSCSSNPAPAAGPDRESTGTGTANPSATGTGTATADPSATGPATPTPEELPMRVLVTGFNDWRELGDPPNVWRCRDNPSCRLLLGAAQDHQPERFEGPLASRLRTRAPSVEWRFATMPVTWDAFAQVPDDVDVIINVGLGVYDRFDTLQLEAGAYNQRQGADAAAAERPGPIDAAAGAVLSAPSDSPIAGRIASVVGRELGGYTVVVAEARPANSYLCNETHFHALTAVGEGRGRLREAYFLHIPYAQDDDYEALAEGVAGLVLGLVDTGASNPP